jgi:hypothetical protein
MQSDAHAGSEGHAGERLEELKRRLLTIARAVRSAEWFRSPGRTRSALTQLVEGIQDELVQLGLDRPLPSEYSVTLDGDPILSLDYLELCLRASLWQRRAVGVAVTLLFFAASYALMYSVIALLSPR